MTLNNSFLAYTLSVFFMIALLVLKAYVAYLVIKVLSEIKLSSPFTAEVSARLERISYLYWAYGWCNAITITHHMAGDQSSRNEGELISGESIFLAGVIFVISQIFKKGVEINLKTN